MEQNEIINYITNTFAGVEVVTGTEGIGAGDTFFFYDPDGTTDPANRLPFATIVTKDYTGYDQSSLLNREGVFRLNVGISRERFARLFGYQPNEFPARGDQYSFSSLNALLPHPVYALQSWVCVLNPSPKTFETFKPLLADAYQVAAKRHSIITNAKRAKNTKKARHALH